MHSSRPGLPRWLSGKRICLPRRRCGFDPWAGKIPWRRAWQPSPVFLPGESHGQRGLVPYRVTESDTPEHRTQKPSARVSPCFQKHASDAGWAPRWGRIRSWPRGVIGGPRRRGRGRRARLLRRGAGGGPAPGRRQGLRTDPKTSAGRGLPRPPGHT